MKKLTTLFLAAMTSCSINAQEITSQDYAKAFKNYNACFILYSVNQHKIVSEYNPNNRCNQRIAPDSTFSLSLIAFNEGIINQKSIFKWNGKKGIIAAHEQDQTPATWLQYSVLWVSQELTPQLGYDKMKGYLASFKYGNQDFSGDPGKKNGLQYAWLSSSLKISAIEQLNFLRAMLSKQLPIRSDAIAATTENLYLGKLDKGADYYGKTGSGRHGPNERSLHPSQLRDGWFIGFINKDGEQYLFVSNLTDKKVQATIDSADGSLKPYGSELLKPITLALLNHYFYK